MKTMPDWLSRAAALPGRLQSNRWRSDNLCARDRRPFRSRRAFQAELNLLKWNLVGQARGLPTSTIRYPHRMLQADSSRSRQHARLTMREQFVSSHADLQSIHSGERK